MNRQPVFLLINPWIYDFAAFDLYLKPLGLLSLAANLKRIGCKIIFIDCMDRLDKYFIDNNEVYNRKYGTGGFYYERIEKPPVLAFYPRYYKRYGLPFDQVKKRLDELKDEKIDAVLVTSIMNYWYPGVFDMIDLVKKYIKAPVFLGGIYATLMHKHALKYSNADHVIGGVDLYTIIGKIFDLLDISGINLDCIKNFQDQEEPLFDLYSNLSYLVVLLSMGCPLNCSYCGSRLLCDRVKIKSLDKVISKAGEYILKYDIKNIAFYDDALLYSFTGLLKKFLLALQEFNLNYHTPNGLHIKLITREVAEYLYQFNFKTIRLSLETTSIRLQKISGKKITREKFKTTMNNLLKAGFSQEGLEVYVMFGFPGQKIKEIEDTIKFIKDHGGKPKIVEYSLIRGTRDYTRYFNKKFIHPLLTNNSVFYQKFTSLTYDDLMKLKQMSKLAE